MNVLASRLERFGRLWRQIERANFGPGVRSEMSQAIVLDRQIADSSPFRAQLQRRLLTAHLTEARRSRDIVRRCTSVRAALRVDPNDRGAQRLSVPCVSQAQRLMGVASGQRGAQAMDTYQRVLQLVPPQSPIAAAARSRLAALRRSHVRDEDE